jgi:hypothetical protein
MRRTIDMYLLKVSVASRSSSSLAVGISRRINFGISIIGSPFMEVSVPMQQELLKTG